MASDEHIVKVTQARIDGKRIGFRVFGSTNYELAQATFFWDWVKFYYDIIPMTVDHFIADYLQDEEDPMHEFTATAMRGRC